MRWYSLSLVSGCFTIILLGFLFRKQIARLLNWCVEMLRQGIIFLLKLGPAGEESAPPPASEIPPAAPPELGLPKSEGSSAFWTVSVPLGRRVAPARVEPGIMSVSLSDPFTAVKLQKNNEISLLFCDFLCKIPVFVFR